MRKAVLIRFVVLSISVVLLFACAHFDGPKTVQIWPAPEPGGQYPEQIELKLKQDTFGIAFQGGGTRAAPAAIGQVRMLNKLGWFENADYVSTISGGTWGVAPYIFLPENYYEARAHAIAKNEFISEHKNGKPENWEPETSNKTIKADIDRRTEDKKQSFIEHVLDPCIASQPIAFTDAQKRRSCINNIFLTEYVPPESINEEILQAKSEAATYSFLRIMADNSKVFKKSLESWFWDFQGDEVYANVLGKVFLRDLGLYQESHLMSHATNSAVAYDRHHIEALSPKVDINNFVFPRTGMPYLIAGTTLMRNSSSQKNFYRFEMTPIYTGSLGEHKIKDKKESHDPLTETRCGNLMKNERCVGGYIETYAFDAKYALAPDNTISKISYCTAFSLADILAASGAAPAQTLMRIGKYSMAIGGTELLGQYVLTGALQGGWSIFGGVALGLGYALYGNAGFPEFRYLDISTPAQTVEPPLHKQQDSFGDGGHLENSGIMSLLARKVKRIIVFVNTMTPYRKDPLTGEVKMDHNLISLFRLPEYFAVQGGEDKGDSELMKIYKHYPYNGVFNEEELGRLIHTFTEKSAKGEPLVSCGTYTVNENAHYNIAPYQAKICWVYLQPSQKWLNSLDTSLCSATSCTAVRNLKNHQDEFEHFPNYWTFMNNLHDREWSLIEVSAPQANALSQYTSWVVQQSAKEIGTYLGLPNDMATN